MISNVRTVSDTLWHAPEGPLPSKAVLLAITGMAHALPRLAQWAPTPAHALLIPAAWGVTWGVSGGIIGALAVLRSGDTLATPELSCTLGALLGAASAATVHAASSQIATGENILKSGLEGLGAGVLVSALGLLALCKAPTKHPGTFLGLLTGLALACAFTGATNVSPARAR